MRNAYAAQVGLLVRILPLVAREAAFALKGGTAINLFYRDLPRLSVDIDLTYLPLADRMESLAAMDEAMNRIVTSIESVITGARAQRISGGGGQATRIKARLGSAEIKIEASPVARGTVHAAELRQVFPAVEDEFGFAEIQVVSFEDLFGGKLHAALDRQHPRDLYDVRLLYENEGLTDGLFRTFLIYLATSGRPAHELLDPNLVDLDHFYSQEFEGMTTKPISLSELLDTRIRLIGDLQSRIDEDTKRFLLSMHDGEPDFHAIGLPQAAVLPAVQWKILNLKKLKKDNPDKHTVQRQNLEVLFR